MRRPPAERRYDREFRRRADLRRAETLQLMRPPQYTPLAVAVGRPWGRFEQYTHNLPCTVKIITVSPGGVLSRQYHFRRDELWVVLDEGAEVEMGQRVFRPEAGESLFIPRETVHRLSHVGGGDGEVRVLEISFGEFDEEDIVRLEDRYGRE